MHYESTKNGVILTFAPTTLVFFIYPRWRTRERKVEKKGKKKKNTLNHQSSPEDEPPIHSELYSVYGIMDKNCLRKTWVNSENIRAVLQMPWKKLNALHFFVPGISMCHTDKITFTSPETVGVWKPIYPRHLRSKIQGAVEAKMNKLLRNFLRILTTNKRKNRKLWDF